MGAAQTGRRRRMALWSRRGKCNKIIWVSLAGLLALLPAAGCGGNSKPGDGGSAGQPNAATSAASAAPADAAAKATPVALDTQLQNSFLNATLRDPPRYEPRPPDVTKAGKAVG